MEFIAGPILALLISMKFTDYKAKDASRAASNTALQINNRLEAIEKQLEGFNNAIPKQILATISPVAKAVQQLNQQIGL